MATTLGWGWFYDGVVAVATPASVVAQCRGMATTLGWGWFYDGVAAVATPASGGSGGSPVVRSP